MSSGVPVPKPRPRRSRNKKATPTVEQRATTSIGLRDLVAALAGFAVASIVVAPWMAGHRDDVEHNLR